MPQVNNEAYLGNPNLKRANTAVEFTKKQVLEFDKCMDDPTYFVEKYVKIVSLDDNQFYAGVGVGLTGPALIWSIYKLYKYFKNKKECSVK